ncbi:hypothetical protein V8G54_018969 [Vigna mungo]|uniref:Uncharacterized protein n=1 Tax=Vigna mungo TaxID=3915 RepID=A0AAQ3NBS6_VIGMU
MHHVFIASNAFVRHFHSRNTASPETLSSASARVHHHSPSFLHFTISPFAQPLISPFHRLKPHKPPTLESPPIHFISLIQLKPSCISSPLFFSLAASKQKVFAALHPSAPSPSPLEGRR